MEKYEQISTIGEGSYGVVMKCKHLATNELVAVKKFLETEEDAASRRIAIREIRMLKKLKHENLVTMIDAFRHRKRFYIVFEYLEFTVMDELQRKPTGLDSQACKERVYQVVRAIDYCHKNNVIHRDVKPENVLVSARGIVKLCDFGFARIHNTVTREPCTGYVATRWYRAPELLVGERQYGRPVDIWAIGCLFSEMKTGEPIFPGDSDVDQLYLTVRMLGKPCAKHQKLLSKKTRLTALYKEPFKWIGLNKAFSSWPINSLNFLEKCLNMDPHQRATAEELLKHSYFAEDRFAQRFPGILREKVEMSFKNPLLKKFKEEVLRSTDTTDSQQMKSQQAKSKWVISLTESSLKKRTVTR